MIPFSKVSSMYSGAARAFGTQRVIDGLERRCSQYCISPGVSLLHLGCRSYARAAPASVEIDNAPGPALRMVDRILHETMKSDAAVTLEIFARLC